MRIHILGICGTFMGGLAMLARPYDLFRGIPLGASGCERGV